MAIQISRQQIKDSAINADKIAAGSVSNAAIASDAAIVDTKLATISTSNKVSGSAVQLADSGGLEDSSGLQIASSGVTNAMLAGSIQNSKLSNSSVTIAGQSLSLGGSLASATLAGALVLSDIGTATADVAMGSNKITGLAAPTADTDAATKGYVDAAIEGLDPKDSVRVATTANITIASDLNVGDTIDGVTLADGDRVLVKDQSTGSENGIYIAGASPARSDDLATSAKAAGIFVFVEEGTVNSDNGFVCTSNAAADTVGTHALSFTQFSGAGQIVAGDALTKTGNRLDVAVDDSSIEVSGDTLQVKASGITNAMLAGSISAAKLVLDSVGGIANAGGGLAIELDGSSLALGSDGLKIADNGVSNAMLAGGIQNAKLSNSTISGVSLGANLNSLSAGNGLSMTSYNGSAAVSDLTIDLDGSTLAVGGSGIKISDGGVDTTQLADGACSTAKMADAACTTAKLADDAVTAAKLGARIRRDVLSPDGSATAFNLSLTLDAGHVEVLVYKNGLLMENDSDSDDDSYQVSADGGTGGVGLVTFGAAPAATDVIHAVFIA